MKPDITLYEWLKGHDVFTWLEPLWDTGRWFLNDEGKLQAVRTQVAIDTPWVHHGHVERDDCFIGQLMFNAISQKMKQFFSDGEPWVPSGCQDCYKVVVRPKTLVQLFALDELQEAWGHPSKCGIEVRSSVHGLYGGYFYNQGLDAGRRCFDMVRQAVDNDPHLGSGVPVILKRGCTEMEHAAGASDKWSVTEEQKVIEALVREHLVVEPDLNRQPDPVVWRTKRKWIEWAFSHGDESYQKFSDGPIVPAYVTFHKEDEHVRMSA